MNLDLNIQVCENMPYLSLFQMYWEVQPRDHKKVSHVSASSDPALHALPPDLEQNHSHTDFVTRGTSLPDSDMLQKNIFPLDLCLLQVNSIDRHTNDLIVHPLYVKSKTEPKLRLQHQLLSLAHMGFNVLMNYSLIDVALAIRKITSYLWMAYELVIRQRERHLPVYLIFKVCMQSWSVICFLVGLIDTVNSFCLYTR